MISLQCKKILVVGGRLLDPRDSYNNENKELNKDSNKDLTKKWKNY